MCKIAFLTSALRDKAKHRSASKQWQTKVYCTMRWRFYWPDERDYNPLELNWLCYHPAANKQNHLRTRAVIVTALNTR
jgi:hypothetical protein